MTSLGILNAVLLYEASIAALEAWTMILGGPASYPCCELLAHPTSENGQLLVQVVFLLLELGYQVTPKDFSRCCTYVTKYP